MINRVNYLLLKEYLNSLATDSKRHRISLTRYEFYLRHLLNWADEIPFSLAHSIPQSLPIYAQNLPGKNGKGLAAPETIKKIINNAKAFFNWAKEEHEADFSTLPKKWIDNLSSPRIPKDILTVHDYVEYDEILQIARAQIPSQNLTLLRDQAAACFLYLSGARAAAFTTLPILAIDLPNRLVYQSPKLGVHTKNKQGAVTALLKIDELLAPVKRWDEIVRSTLPNTAPWYASIEQSWGANHKLCAESGKNRNIALDKRLGELYEFVGLEYKSAHKFRHGYAVYGITHARSMAQYQAVSRNLMHANISITDEIYASINIKERQRLLDALVTNATFTPDDELTNYLSSLSKDDLQRSIGIAVKIIAM